MNISDLINESRDLSFDYGGGTINLTYRPNAFTPEHEMLQLEAKERQYSSGMVMAMLIPLIVKWDLTMNVPDPSELASGKPPEKCKQVEVPVPVTQEGFNKVPLKLQTAMLKAVMDDNSVPNAKGTSSGGSLA